MRRDMKMEDSEREASTPSKSRSMGPMRRNKQTEDYDESGIQLSNACIKRRKKIRKLGGTCLIFRNVIGTYTVKVC